MLNRGTLYRTKNNPIFYERDSVHEAFSFSLENNAMITYLEYCDQTKQHKFLFGETIIVTFLSESSPKEDPRFFFTEQETT